MVYLRSRPDLPVRLAVAANRSDPAVPTLKVPFMAEAAAKRFRKMWLSEFENMKKLACEICEICCEICLVKILFVLAIKSRTNCMTKWENAVEPRGSHRDAACKLRWPRMDGTFFVMWSSEWLGIWSFQSWSFCHGPRIFSSDTSWCDAKFLEWEGNWFVLCGMTLPMVCARVYIVYKKTLRDLEILPWDPWWPEKNGTKITKSFRVDVQNFGFSQDWSLWIPLRCVQSWFARERFLWSFRESSP